MADCCNKKPLDPERTDVVKMSCCPPSNPQKRKVSGTPWLKIFSWLLMVAGLVILVIAIKR